MTFDLYIPLTHNNGEAQVDFADLYRRFRGQNGGGVCYRRRDLMRRTGADNYNMVYKISVL